jgi:hypothetical protein
LLYLRLPPLGLLKLVEVEESRCAAITLPIEIVGWVAVAAKFEAGFVSGGTMREGNMIIRDVVEEMDLVL